MKILVTGAAGFIGARLALMLAKRGDEVLGIDNINDYYDVRLKYGRLRECGIESDVDDMAFCKMYQSTKYPSLRFMRMSIEEKQLLDYIFETERFDVVVNLAAQAGVRYSIANPYSYMQSNLVGFLNILEACRFHGVKKLVFASSSSVYGMNDKTPFSEEDKVDTPVSLYAASKKSNELMAHCYSKLYGIHAIGLRFFTVYGPWGRPDMSPMLFANALRDNKPIKVFNNGDMLRDFTYIDDIVEGTICAVDYNLKTEDCPNGVAYRIYNIGCGHPVRLMDFINEIELAYGKKAEKVFLPMQPGDVYQTYADTSRLRNDMGYCPHWSLNEGIVEFMKWYNSKTNPLN
ncbi:MAG: NAD-dependent epimerase/dehydratase family protein [Bacteroidales bacterium]|nr:NAD-dependent epimerase/dehydratase family protein [Bacteroidales bacterium]